jgi:Ni,Fe-hydrogenase III large subunit
MAELERLANHFGDIGAICNDASFAIMHAQCGILRERVLRAADRCFGHRLMMDRIVPGGVASDLRSGGPIQLVGLLNEVREVFPRLVDLYDNTASLQDRTATTGILRAELARQFGAGGYVGRASNRAFDARKRPGYPPYDQLDFEMAVFDAGDVNARVWVRIREVEQSLRLIDQILQRLRDGPVAAAVDLAAGKTAEGLGFVEGFRGDILVWLRIEGGRIARCHLRDPSWFQWPLLEAVIEGNIVADFPLCNKSFNCSYSGHDLLVGRRRCAGPCSRALFDGRSPNRRREMTMQHCRNWPQRSIAQRGEDSVAACRSAKSMPVPATAANSKSTRLTMRFTILNASDCASSLRRGTPTS